MSVSEKKRDMYRENVFKDAYGIENVRIWVTNYNDDKGNWDMVVLNFRDSLGKNYGLIEHFKDGDDNSTKFVILEYESGLGFEQKRYERFIDAEQEMVRLMKCRLEGKY